MCVCMCALSISRASRRDGVSLNWNGVNRCAVAFGRRSFLCVCLSVCRSLSSGSWLLVRNEPGHVQARQQRCVSVCGSVSVSVSVCASCGGLFACLSQADRRPNIRARTQPRTHTRTHMHTHVQLLDLVYWFTGILALCVCV